MRLREIAHERKAFFLFDNFQSLLASGQCHRRARFNRTVGRVFTGLYKQLQQSSIFFSASCSESDKVDLFSIESTNNCLKGRIIDFGAVWISPGWRVSFVQSQPFLGLLDAIVMK